MAISVSSVKTDLFTMDYFRFGTGPRTMVILPGLSIQSVIPSAELVAQAYQSFARDYTVYVFDRRKDLPPSYSIGEMAKDTVIAMHTLGLTDIYLFGASQGGMIAQVIAIRFPGLVHKLVLGSSACHIGEETPEAVAQWILLARQRKAKALCLDFAEKVYPEDLFRSNIHSFEAMADGVTENDLRRFVTLAEGTAGFSTRADLHRVVCPVYVLGSKDDKVLGGNAGSGIIKALGFSPEHRLYLYEGYGHACYDTAPDFKDRMRDFFRS